MSLHQNLDGVSRLKGDLLAIAKSRKYKIRGFQTLPEGNMGFQVTTNRMRGRTAIGRFSFVKVKKLYLNQLVFVRTIFNIIIISADSWIGLVGLTVGENFPAEN